MIGLDEWRTATPPDDDEPCSRCEGRGEYPWPVRTWFDDRHGFDSVDEWRACLACDGTGRRQ